MIKKYAFCFIYILSGLSTFCQNTNQGTFFLKKSSINENTIVTDTAGLSIPYTVWNRLKTGGEYGMKPKNYKDENTAYILFKLSAGEIESIKAFTESLPKPRESSSFKTGEHFTKIKTTDIYGNKINTRELTGKIVVINFWFTSCAPCVSEIPELNKTADKYKNDSDIVFIAIALDDPSSIANFLKSQSFKYLIIGDGESYARRNSINTYPTNVVLDKTGRVYFHTAGLSPNTVFWINKSIEELKSRH